MVRRQELADHCHYTVDFNPVDQAAHGIRRLRLFPRGQLVRMEEETMINQQAQDQAMASSVSAPLLG